MIKLIATTESVDQARQLFDAGVDELIIGEKTFGLRLAGYFTQEEMAEIIETANTHHKSVTLAMNAILHNDKIRQARPFLKEIKTLGIQHLMVGDTGLIQILKEEAYKLPYTYDASVLVTSAGQVNFWAKYGAVRALMAREVPLKELELVGPQAQIPLMFQVFGPTCIHQSKRPLLDNYFNYIGKDKAGITDRELFLSEPTDPHTHYSIYSDSHGTHIFANKDLNLIKYLPELAELGIHDWYLDGLFSTTEGFVEICRAFAKAKEAIEQGLWSDTLAEELSLSIQQHQVVNRELDTGFFLLDPAQIQ